MRRARRNSALVLIALAAAVIGFDPGTSRAMAAPPQRPPKEDATHRQIDQAERDRAAEQAAQQAATARAAAAAAEAQRLTAERVAAAAELRHAETTTAEVAARMDQLAAQRRQAQADLDARAEAMQPLLPLIERLSLYPAETLLAVPAQPEETLRGVLVLHGLASQLARDSLALRDEQARLDAATRAVAAEAPKLAVAEAAQQAQAAQLDRQIAAAEAGRDAAAGEAAAAAQRGADAAARADKLRGMLADLAAQRRTEDARARADTAVARESQAALERPAGPGAIATTAQPHGQFIVPVAGTVIRSWGDATDGGPATGLSYRAPPAARVVSPCGGRVVFAAPFRSYGQLLIVDCGGGYHAVLAGFDRLDAKVGQQVAAGEPVGVAPSWEPGSSGSRPTLYMELRRDGQPVNPVPWLKASS